MTKSSDIPDIDPMHSPLSADPKFMTGQGGVIAVDKIANKILFLGSHDL